MGIWPVLNSRSLAPICISSPVHKSCPECLPFSPDARRAAFAWNRVTSTLGAAAGPAALSPFPASHPRASVLRICRRPLPRVKRSHSGSGTEDRHEAAACAQRGSVPCACLRLLGRADVWAVTLLWLFPAASGDPGRLQTNRTGLSRGGAGCRGRNGSGLCFLSAGNTPCAYRMFFRGETNLRPSVPG